MIGLDRLEDDLRVNVLMKTSEVETRKTLHFIVKRIFLRKAACFAYLFRAL